MIHSCVPVTIPELQLKAAIKQAGPLSSLAAPHLRCALTPGNKCWKQGSPPTLSISTGTYVATLVKPPNWMGIAVGIPVLSLKREKLGNTTL